MFKDERPIISVKGIMSGLIKFGVPNSYSRQYEGPIIPVEGGNIGLTKIEAPDRSTEDWLFNYKKLAISVKGALIGLIQIAAPPRYSFQGGPIISIWGAIIGVTRIVPPNRYSCEGPRISVMGAIIGKIELSVPNRIGQKIIPNLDNNTKEGANKSSDTNTSEVIVDEKRDQNYVPNPPPSETTLKIDNNTKEGAHKLIDTNKSEEKYSLHCEGSILSVEGAIIGLTEFGASNTKDRNYDPNLPPVKKTPNLENNKEQRLNNLKEILCKNQRNYDAIKNDKKQILDSSDTKERFKKFAKKINVIKKDG